MQDINRFLANQPAKHSTDINIAPSSVFERPTGFKADSVQQEDSYFCELPWNFDAPFKTRRA